MKLQSRCQSKSTGSDANPDQSRAFQHGNYVLDSLGSEIAGELHFRPALVVRLHTQ